MTDNNDTDTHLRHVSGVLDETQGMIDRMLNDPVLGKMFIKPDFDLPPLPWEVQEVEGEQ